jgi:hypothetical protein
LFFSPGRVLASLVAPVRLLSASLGIAIVNFCGTAETIRHTLICRFDPLTVSQGVEENK